VRRCPKARCDGAQNVGRVADGVVVTACTLLSLVGSPGITPRCGPVRLPVIHRLGDRDCEFVKTGKSAPRSYAENAFVGGVGPLFDQARALNQRPIPRRRSTTIMEKCGRRVLVGAAHRRQNTSTGALDDSARR